MKKRPKILKHLLFIEQILPGANYIPHIMLSPRGNTEIKRYIACPQEVQNLAEKDMYTNGQRTVYIITLMAVNELQ